MAKEYSKVHAGAKKKANWRLHAIGWLLPAVAVSSTCVVSPTIAQTKFPTRTVTLVVPFSAGGSTDVLARIVAEGMSKDLGQQVIVENMPGAGGGIAGRRVAGADPDGYTILIGNTGTLAANGGFYKTPLYDPIKDLVAISSVGDAPQIVVAKKGLPAKNLDEFAEYAKKNEGQLSFGSAGVGSGSFLGGTLLNAALGVKIKAVTYRGAGPAMNDIMGEKIDYMVESSTAALPQVMGGTVRGVAVLQKNRIKAAPDVPSAGESKFPDLSYRIWNVVLAPKNTPPEIVSRLNQSIRKTLSDEAISKRMEDLGLEIPESRHQTPGGAADLVKEETERWRPLIAGLGVSLD